MSRLLENKKYLLKTLKIATLLYNSGKYDDCLKYIEKISYSAWYNFAGYYTLNHFESIIRNIAAKSLHFKDQIISEKEDTTLHIFSEINQVGGHTKLLFNWIENDRDSKHYLLSTWQDAKEITDIATSYNCNIDDRLYTFNKESNHLSKAQKIIDILAEKNFSRIVLHIHPHDAIPSLVFSSDRLTSPVFFLNHAEHTYWLGAPVIDYLLQIRESNIKKDSKNRNIPVEDQFFLPIPVDESFSLNKKEKETFNILSIGRESKYEPNAEYNFYEAALNIVKEFDHVVFTIVGISQNNPNRKIYEHDRLVFVEPTRDIKGFIENTDLYLEGFPVPSFTSLLEPAMAGIPFVLHYNPSDIYKVFEEDRENGIFYPENLENWHETVGKMISDESYRREINTKQESYLKNNFSLQAWKNKLKNCKENTKNKTHKVRAIPQNETYVEGTDEKIVSLIEIKNVNHYTFTENLGIVSKLKVVALSFDNPSWVKVLSKKRTLGYLLGK